MAAGLRAGTWGAGGDAELRGAEDGGGRNGRRTGRPFKRLKAKVMQNDVFFFGYGISISYRFL